MDYIQIHRRGPGATARRLVATRRALDQCTVHAVGYRAVVAAAAVARRLPTPIVAEFDGIQTSWRWQRLSQTGFFSPRVDRILLRHERQMRAFRPARPLSRLCLVRHGVRLDWYDPLDPDTSESHPGITVGACLSDVSKQELRLLLGTMSWLPGNCQARLLLFGPEALCERARRRVAACGSSVRASTRVKSDAGDPSHLWRECELSVHTMVTAGADKRLVDAMASDATPIVCAPTAEEIEPVRDGFSGLVVSPGNPWSLSQAIHYLAENPARRARMASNGRKRVAELYGIDACVEAIAALHRELLWYRQGSRSLGT